ncbi:FMN-dependent dehydrogenase-domain-containing protein [Daldinia caldariorum]|uniref:FMN-dependent dehydrogenase-domain-containing protein n=1 Tax=Daldinia caldariorum TaxID=326644 RepID=UPI00200737B6|nr:FMN-dependent dehydrogenase-domain-containing protein [Daldinia caldariorum]KAI1468642.1 FMN-dependent dehydrogenase-domain-containing protein [Daldinia caldariorum]
MAEKLISAEEVVKHTTPESCWVVLYGNVYDVTEFLPSHPGGSKIILQLAGRDATDEYDPIHPPGTLEENLKPEAKLGRIDPQTIVQASKPAAKEEKKDVDGVPPMESLLNLNEIEEVATKRMPEKAWAYYYSSSDDTISKSFNNTVYKDILLRPRVFVDCTKCDTSTTLLGHKVDIPIFVAPAAMARLGHPDGEAGIARACGRFNALQVISNNASMTPEQIVADAVPGGQIFGWQLYVQNDRAKSEAMLARINRLADKFKFVCLTLDAPVPGKRELDEKQSFKNAVRVASGVKTSDEPNRPGGGGVGQQLFFGTASDLTWKITLPWLAKHTDLPIVLKGIQTHEDAFLAAKYAPQVRAIILSNHGGRALDTAPPAVHTLLEIRKHCPQVFDQIEVWVDGGIKRGTDVVKALCLGARAVGIGRAALFGLGAGGQKGVERTLEILKAEIETCMRLLGVEKVSDLGPRHINSRKVERDIFDGDAGLETFGLWDKVKSRL